MARRLTDLVIKEVSSVDRGAGRGVKVLLMKRDEPLRKATDFDSAEHAGAVQRAVGALQKAIASILDDPEVVAKLDAVSESIDQFRDHVASLGLEKNMPLPKTDEELAKMIADGATAAVTKALADAKAVSDAALEKANREVRLAKMTPAHKSYMDECGMDDEKKKSFADMTDEQRDEYAKKNPVTKRDDPMAKELAKRDTEIADLKKRLDETALEKSIVDFGKRAVAAGLKEADGEIMRKAYGGDKEAQTKLEALQKAQADALAEARRTGGIFKEFGAKGGGAPVGANAEVVAKADELRKAEPKLTKEQAYAKVFADPANAELAKRVRDEEISGKVAA